MNDDVTSTLSAIEQGDPRAAEQLLPLQGEEARLGTIVRTHPRWSRPPPISPQEQHAMRFESRFRAAGFKVSSPCHGISGPVAFGFGLLAITFASWPIAVADAAEATASLTVHADRAGPK